MYNVEIKEYLNEYRITLRQFEGVNFFKHQCSNELLKKLMESKGYKCKDNSSFYFELAVKYDVNIMNLFSNNAKMKQQSAINEVNEYINEVNEYINEVNEYINEIKELLMSTLLPFDSVFKCSLCGFNEYYRKSLYSSETGLTCCSKCNNTYNINSYSLDKQRKALKVIPPIS